MADLENRFAQWRRELAEALGGSAETLEELEEHLRDDVNRRIAAGEPPGAAFAAAAAHMGNPAALAAEFARVTPPAPWLPVRFAVIALLAYAGLLGGILWSRGGTLLGMHVVCITLGYSITLVVGALAACYVVARPFGTPAPRQLQGLLRATRQLVLAAFVLTALGIVLGGIWAQEQLGRFWGWDVRETGGLGVLLWDAAMFLILSKRPFGDHATLLLGFAGNAVVAMAWFGPAALGIGLHDYGMLSLTLPVTLFVLAQAALACLGLVPAGAMARRVRQS
jgi:hypothetical protein